jgi:hypothetical protein
MNSLEQFDDASRVPQSLKRLLILSLYLAFALAVYLAHGPRPDINIDHIAYFKLANDIRAEYPNHDYWRAATATRSFAVVMAYFYGFTGDHIRTLKILLVGMTVAYLLTAEYFFSCFTRHRWLAVLFSVVSSVHVSFGAVFWGVTDFSASLNRTLVVPPMLLMLGWYFNNYTRHRRFLVYPALIYLSVLHLGTYYLLGALAVMDGLRLAYLIRSRKSTFWLSATCYVLAFMAVAIAYESIAHFNLGSTVLSMLVPRIEDKGTLVPRIEDKGTLVPRIENKGTLMPRIENEGTVVPRIEDKGTLVPDIENKGIIVPRIEKIRTDRSFLSSGLAWDMEIFAQPWRNFPPPLATVLGMAMSLAFIVPLSVVGGYFAIRKKDWKPFDKPMLLFACSVFICAYGLQCFLWTIRHWIAIYPINFEEVRTICFIYLPILYFTLRGFEWLWYTSAVPNSRAIAIAGLLLIVVQPIRLVRLLPRSYLESFVETAQRVGVLDKRESQRNIYARQVLGLEADRQRFYYCVLPVLNWLSAHTNANTRVLTSRSELYLLDAKVIGTSNGFLNTDPRSPVRMIWHDQVLELDAALSAHNIQRVEMLARANRADFAVVQWDEPSGVYDDGNFSVIATK